MTHPGLTFGIMLAVAIGTAIYYYFNNENPTLNYDHHGQRYHPQTPPPNTGTTIRPGNRRRRNSNGSAKDCIICLDSLKSSNSKEISCGHIFHKDCIDMWLRINSTCPCCRVAV